MDHLSTPASQTGDMVHIDHYTDGRVVLWTKSGESFTITHDELIELTTK